MSAISGQTWII